MARRAAAVALTLWLPCGAGAQPLLETGANAEITEDGLHRVAESIMDAAWVVPDLDLSAYDALYLRPTGVSFNAGGGGGNRAGRLIQQTEFPISDDLKLQMRGYFQETLLQELSSVAGYAVSAVPGRSVLMVQGFLVDVSSDLPPAETGTAFIQNLSWEATIVLELRDSMSDDILARTVERERVQEIVDSGLLPEQMRQLVRRWARLLHTRFDELTAIAQ